MQPLTEKQQKIVEDNINKVTMFCKRSYIYDEDIKSELMLTMMNAVACFDVSKNISLSTYIYRSLINRFINILRDKTKDLALQPFIDEINSPIEKQSNIKLKDAILELTKIEQALVSKVFYDNLYIKDAAKVLKLSKKNAYRIMQEILIKLKGKLVTVSV